MTNVDIDNICNYLGISNYTINEEDMSIDVLSSVYLPDKEMVRLPLKFNNIGGSFYSLSKRLESLDGCPKYVGLNFSFDSDEIVSLESENIFDIVIKGSMFFSGRNIRSFKGFPQNFTGFVNCTGSLVHEVYKLFKENSKCIYWLNEYDVIRGENIVLDRLEEVFYQLEMEVPDIKEVKGYNLI